MTFIDPGDQPKRRSRKPDVKAPEPASLFDISDQPPPTPFQVKSPTSTDAAKEIRPSNLTSRRAAVLRVIRNAPRGLARYQVAAMLRLPDHWISSSVDALIKQRKIEESDATVINPESGKACSVLVAIVASEESAA